MTQPTASATAAGIRTRLGHLEAHEAGPTTGGIVQYRTADTPEEIRRRIPAGADLVILLPWNGRDPDRDPGPPPTGPK